MTKREAKQWACGMAASLLRSDSEYLFEEQDPDREKKQAAMDEIIRELQRRSGETY